MAVKLGNGNWAVKENKLLAYNDNSGRFFNKEFDFSRGSSATYVGKDGLIKTSDLQSTNLLQNGNFSELSSELVTNGDFSSDSDWTVGASWTIDNGFANSNGGQSFLTQNVGFVVGLTYLVTFNINRNSGNLFVRDSSGVTKLIINENNDTTLQSFYFTSTSSGIINFYSYDYNGSIDNVSVKQVDPNDNWSVGTGWSIGNNKATSDGSANVGISQNVSFNSSTLKIKFKISDLTQGSVRLFVNTPSFTQVLQAASNGSYEATVSVSSGANNIYFYSTSNFIGSISNISVQEIKTNTPRIDFSDSTNGALLLEGQSTNLVTYSQDFSQHSILGGTITSDDIVSPDGGINADTFVEDTANSQHRIRKDINVTAGTYTMSCFIKGTDRFISFYPQSAGTAFAVFDIANTTITKTGGSNYVDSNIQNYGNGWFRCILTYTVSTGTSALHIYLSNLSTGAGAEAPIYTGNGSEMSFYGLQLEDQSYATSYIPSLSGSTTTRLADVCNNSGSAQDFNSEEGVLYAEIAALANDGTYRQILLHDNAYNNRIALRYMPTSNEIDVYLNNGTVQAQFNYTLTNALDFNKIAFSFKENDFSLWVNGVEVATETSGTTFSANTLQKIDFDFTNNYFFYGNIKDLQVFTTALTDEQLAALTTI